MPFIERMRDAARASGIPAGWKGIVAGYLPVGDPAHAWDDAEWNQFPRNRKLPIVAKSNPGSASGGEADAWEVLKHLYRLRVPIGAPTALDLETAEDAAYVIAYGRVLNWFGYKVLPYGSKSTLVKNPELNGYWVADWSATDNDPPPHMTSIPGKVVRMTQYAHDVEPGFDRSTVKWWIRHRWAWWT